MAKYNDNPTAAEAVELGRFALTFARVQRATFHPDGKRRETDSDHTVMLGLIALAFCPRELDHGIVAEFCLVHDLVETYAGDTDTSMGLTARQAANKAVSEDKALKRIVAEFNEAAPWLIRRMRQYEQQQVAEARYVRLLDKAMPKITHILNRGEAYRRSGVALADMERAHTLQLVKLRSEYPELRNGAFECIDRLFVDLMEAAEDAMRVGGTPQPVGPIWTPDWSAT